MFASIRHAAALAAGFMSLFAASAFAQPFAPVRFEEVDSGTPYEIPEGPVSSPTALAGSRVAIVAAHGFEEVELTYPLRYLKARGAKVDVITPDWIEKRVMAVQFLKPSVWIPTDKKISQANVADYDLVFVPGGAWNPIIMRTDGKVLDFLREADRKGLLIASVCHGPQVLISAGLVRRANLPPTDANRRRVTGVGDIRIDLRNAGATVVEDQPVVIHEKLITARDPNDLDELMPAIEGALKERNRSNRFSQIYARSTGSGARTSVAGAPAAPTTSSYTTTCSACNGSGRLFGGPGYYPYTCSTCNGRGTVPAHGAPVWTGP